MLCCACLLLNHACLILLYVYVLPFALQVGEDGAGHYVKMVHNGIEYGDMQLIGEAYHLMKAALGMSTDEMSAVLTPSLPLSLPPSLSLSLSPSFCITLPSLFPSFYLFLSPPFSPPPPPSLSLRFSLTHSLFHPSSLQVFKEWNKGELDSFLIEITTDILAFKDTDGKPLVEKIRDAAGQKGTGKWTAISALDKGMPLTLIGQSGSGCWV